MSKRPHVQNAVIDYADIRIERGFILTDAIGFNLEEGGCQGLGGYALHLGESSSNFTPSSPAGHFIFRLMEVAGVESFSKLKGQCVRIQRDGASFGANIIAVGHIVKNDWFDFRDFMHQWAKDNGHDR